MRLLRQTTPTPIDKRKISDLEKKVKLLKSRVDNAEKDMKVAAATIEKMSTMLSDISSIQRLHVEQTANMQMEFDNLLNVLFPKDEIKFDLLNDTYN